MFKAVESERHRAANALRRAGAWPGQRHWTRSAMRQGRVQLYRAAWRLVGGRDLGAFPFNWVSSVAEIEPHAMLAGRIEDRTSGCPECRLVFPDAPPPFELFTKSVDLTATTDFMAVDPLVSPRTGLVWYEGGAILGESYGSMLQFLSWGYAAHDLFGSKKADLLIADRPLVCVPSSGYFHLILESLPGLLRLLERGHSSDIVLWSAAPRYVREVASLLQSVGTGRVLEAPAPVRVRRVRIAGRRQLSGHFDALDLARLRRFAEDVARSSAPKNLPDRVFVTRAGASRALANEADISKSLVPLGFTVLDPGRLSVVEQMAAFRSARVVVGSHGGGLANLAWCRPGAAVVEILRPERSLDCYARLSHLSDLRYRPQTTSATGHVDLDNLLAVLADLGVR